jgi:very-short-patch-repair endonuclease
VDLLEPFAGLGLEYDGAQHRELGRHTADNLREEGLEANGLAIVRVTSLDLDDERATIGRIQDAHQRRLFRDRTAETWTCQPRIAGVGGGL